MNRGARRQAIFLTDHDRRSFLSLLSDAADEFGMRVLCVCLMDNHFHLLVQSMGANLSQAMRHVGGIHALRFNEHNATDGPLFRGRFRSLVVADDDYLLTVARYIDHNPVAAGLCHFDVATSALASGSNGIENEPRMVAVSLVRRHSALPPAEVAKRYGFGSTSSVRSALRRHPDLLTAAPLASLTAAAASFSADAAA
jgi:REP element-mobilizing transposase RayT